MTADMGDGWVTQQEWLAMQPAEFGDAPDQQLALIPEPDPAGTPMLEEPEE